MLPILAQLTHAIADCVAQAARQREGRLAGGHQLFHEERIAAGSGQDGVHELGVRHLAGDARHQVGHVVAAERAQLDVVDALEPLKLREQRPKGG